MVERTRAEDEIGVESEGCHPMCMIFQCMQWTALQVVRSEETRNLGRRTFSASHIRTVRSLLAVYNTPYGPPVPPHFTTLTLAVWPPNVYSVLLVASDQTRTVPSLDDDARRGAEGLLAS